jgi:small subunit ribosomal protein S16
VSTTIRLTRMGRKKRPFYRLVVTDSRTRRDGAFIANLGFYNPFVDPLEVKLHDEEIVAWLKKGATTSPTARALMKREGILYRWELVRQGLAQDEIDAKVASWKAESTGRFEAKARNKVATAEKAKAAELKAKEEAEKKVAEEAAAAKAAEEAEKKAAEKAAADEAAAEAAEAETPAEEAPAEEPGEGEEA